MQLHHRVLGHAMWAALGCASFPVWASAGSTTLPQIVVTATRTPETVDATLAPVTVITRKEIEQLQPSSLQDLLNDTPGVAIINEGGPGKLTSLFLRGTNSNQVLVLVDGFRIGNATAGTAPFQDIPVDQIQRIEIVRGPFSSLYGADALGGVIQIFLRHAPGTFTPNASVGVGSYSHWKATGGFSAAGRHGWISVQASHQQTKGINACKVGAAEAFAGCFADQPDRDGFHNSSLSLHGAYQFDNQWSVDGLALRTKAFNKYDGTFSNAENPRTQVVGGQLHYQPTQRLKVSLRIGSSSDLDSDFLNGAYVDTFDTHRTLGSLVADAALGSGLLTAGVDWQRQHIVSSTVYTETTRTDRSLFAEWQQRFGSQSLQASLRRDQNSQYGGKTTGSLLWGWNFAKNLRLTADYGTAFVAPTFNDLYYPGFSNPNLRPASSHNVDLGLRGTPGWGHWSLSVYRDDIRDMIALGPAFVPENIARARITGVEGVLDTTLAGWNVRATATVMNPENRQVGALHGNQLPRRPRRSERFDLDRSFGRFSFGASWYVNSHTYDDTANTHRLGGYGLVNLRAGWKFSRAWQLQLALNNAFDKDYETAYFYNEPGRNYMLTLSWRPSADRAH